MKTAIIGAGAVGGYFGAQMLRSGLDATLVARGAHYTALTMKGLTVQTVDGVFHLQDLPVVSAITHIHRPELVLISPALDLIYSVINLYYTTIAHYG